MYLFNLFYTTLNTWTMSGEIVMRKTSTAHVDCSARFGRFDLKDPQEDKVSAKVPSCSSRWFTRYVNCWRSRVQQ